MYIKNSADLRVNGFEQKIVPIKCQTFISWSSWLLATEVVTFKTSKPYLVLKNLSNVTYN